MGCTTSCTHIACWHLFAFCEYVAVTLRERDDCFVDVSQAV